MFLVDVLRESVILFLDLEGKLPRVAQNEGGEGPRTISQLVQRRQHKYGRLAHARLGLTKNVHSHDALRNTLLLHFAGMLKAAVHDGLHELRAQEEVFEAGRVNPCELKLLSITVCKLE